MTGRKLIPFIYMFTGLVASYETNCLDIRMVTDAVDSRNSAMDDVQHTRRQTFVPTLSRFTKIAMQSLTSARTQLC